MIVPLDSGFSVLKTLLKLKEHGVYAIATIKKRRYWLWGVDGDKLTSHFLSSSIGDSDLIMGSYNSVDFRLPIYVSKYMSTFGTLTIDNAESEKFCLLPSDKKNLSLLSQYSTTIWQSIVLMTITI